MTFEQVYMLTVIIVTLGLFVWGRLRYDVIALSALFAVVVGGIIPINDAFYGFGHPAVVTVAAVLIISKSLQNSGIIGIFTRFVESINVGPSLQIAIISLFVAALSGFMNNVGALTLLLPVVIQIARRSNRAPGELMMPLAFGSLLGGLTTMIGTPPNIIVASFRATASGAPFTMFDFTPVGLLLAVIGIFFISIFGWRLIPIRIPKTGEDALFSSANYLTEVSIPRKSGLSGITLQQFLEDIGETSLNVVALIRGHKKYIQPGALMKLRINDHLLIEGKTDSIEYIIKNTPLQLVGNQKLKQMGNDNYEISAIEVVVSPNSKLVRRSIAQTQIEKRYDIYLLALARQGQRIRKRLRQIKIRAGDVLLLQGDMRYFAESLSTLGCLPLSKRDISLHIPPSFIPVFIFCIVIISSVLGLTSLPIALTGGVIALVLSRQIQVGELYNGVEWPVIVLLGAMVPVGIAMENCGLNDLIADNISSIIYLLPDWGLVFLILTTAMLLSDIINNAATAILMSQLSIKIAERAEVSADPLLMAVAVGSSCAFLTPIGHQSNILVMGPGGYRFGDYWRLGLPLEILILVFSIPMILWIWPL